MAISFLENVRGTLFQRLDMIAAVIERLRSDFAVDGNYETDLKALENSLVGTGITVTGDVAVEDDINGPLRPAYNKFKAAAAEYALTFKACAQALSMRHPWRDSSLYGAGPGPGNNGGSGGLGGSGNLGTGPVGLTVSSSSYKLTHQEIRRQMLAATETVQTCTPAVSAFTAGSTNVGNGTSVSSVKRGDGLTAELIFADTTELRCIQSGYDKNGTRNYELFQAVSKAAVDGSHPDWGGTFFGAGADKKFNVIDPKSDNDRGNLLTNGFETFSNNTPVGWQATTGTAGTDFVMSSGQQYFGSNSLDLIGGTGVLTTLEQSFGSHNALYSTPGKLEGSTQYAVIIRMKADAAPASGAAVIELVDSGNTLNGADDDQGTDNTFTIDLTTLTTSWQSFTGVFRTPRDVADGTKIRLRLTTAIPAARRVYCDSFAVGKMTELYPGGVWVALVAGSTPFASGNENLQRDFFTVTTTNDNGGAAQARRTYARLGDALLDLRLNGILWPSAASETIADSVL